MEAQTVQLALQPIVLKHFGDQCKIQECIRLTAGASAATWLVNCQHSNDDFSLILRLEAGGEQFGTGIGKTCEAKIQNAAAEAGAPVAKVFEIIENHPDLGFGYLMEKLDGESLAPKILRNEEFENARALLTEQCANTLAIFHKMDEKALSFMPVQDAAKQLDDLQTIHEQFGESLPVFSLVFRWLRENIPACETPRLVHGDFRLGNFLVTESGLNGVLDWELAHLGDPMEDLGWLCVRAWRFSRPDKPVGGFGDRQALYAAYENASAVKVNPDDVRYWELFGTLKWGVICQYQAYTHLNGQVRSVERAAIGRRVAETEYDMMTLLDEIVRGVPCL